MIIHGESRVNVLGDVTDSGGNGDYCDLRLGLWGVESNRLEGETHPPLGKRTRATVKEIERGVIGERKKKNLVFFVLLRAPVLSWPRGDGVPDGQPHQPFATPITTKIKG